MKLQLDWGRPLKVAHGVDPKLIYSFDYAKLPTTAGIYLFGRRYGSKIEALYIGKATSLQGRVRGQLKNLPLMLHLQNAKNGDRIVWTGKFISKGGQNQSKCLLLLERALIRHFFSEGHDLVNVQGSRLRRHEIVSVGAKRVIPETMFIDRAKGE